MNDPWQAGALDGIAPSERVLQVGTGLTMADVLASLLGGGHRAVITAILRRALLPKTHGEFGSIDFLAGVSPPRTVRGLLRLARAVAPVMACFTSGLTTTGGASLAAVLGSASLSGWAPCAGDTIAGDCHQPIESATGWRDIDRAGERRLAMPAVPARRLGATGELRACDFLYQTEKNIMRNPLISVLLARGTVSLDAIAAGLAVDRQSRVLDANGEVVRDWYAYGPITRGTFGEMTGAPDIAQHVEELLLRSDPVAGFVQTLAKNAESV